MEKGFKVTPTYSLGDLTGEALKDVKKGFDENPLKEVRERCLVSIWPWGDEDFKWLTERTEAYLEISDFSTTIYLLRRIVLFKPDRGLYGKEIISLQRHITIVDLLVRTLEGLLGKQFLQDNISHIKEALVMLCGRLKETPELYNDKTRKIFQRLCGRYTERKNAESQTVIPICEAFDTKFKEDYERLLQRILKQVLYLKDKEFLPVLYRLGEEQGRSFENFRFDRNREEETTLEALRLLAIRSLVARQ